MTTNDRDNLLRPSIHQVNPLVLGHGFSRKERLTLCYTKGPGVDKVERILKKRAGGGPRRPEHQTSSSHGDHSTWVMVGPGVGR